jgi:hypothetical protein
MNKLRPKVPAQGIDAGLLGKAEKIIRSAAW